MDRVLFMKHSVQTMLALNEWVCVGPWMGLQNIQNGKL